MQQLRHDVFSIQDFGIDLGPVSGLPAFPWSGKAGSRFRAS
jgi:hypothetical protein